MSSYRVVFAGGGFERVKGGEVEKSPAVIKVEQLR